MPMVPRLLLLLLVLRPWVAAAETHADDEQATLAHLDKVADIYDTHQDACDKITADVEAYVAANAELIKRLQAASKKRTKPEKEAMAKTHHKAYLAVAKKMLPGLKKCVNDAKLKAASDKLKM